MARSFKCSGPTAALTASESENQLYGVDEAKDARRQQNGSRALDRPLRSPPKGPTRVRTSSTALTESLSKTATMEQEWNAITKLFNATNRGLYSPEQALKITSIDFY